MISIIIIDLYCERMKSGVHVCCIVDVSASRNVEIFDDYIAGEGEAVTGISVANHERLK